MPVVVGASYRVLDGYAESVSECIDVFDKAFWGAESANYFCGERIAGSKICDGLNKKMDVGSVGVKAVEVNDFVFVVVLLEAAEWAARQKACPGGRRFLPIQAETDSASKAGILESVIANDNVEFVLNFFCRSVAVLGRKDAYFMHDWLSVAL